MTVGLAHRLLRNASWRSELSSSPGVLGDLLKRFGVYAFGKKVPAMEGAAAAFRACGVPFIGAGGSLIVPSRGPGWPPCSCRAPMERGAHVEGCVVCGGLRLPRGAPSLVFPPTSPCASCGLPGPALGCPACGTWFHASPECIHRCWWGYNGGHLWVCPSCSVRVAASLVLESAEDIGGTSLGRSVAVPYPVQRPA